MAHLQRDATGHLQRNLRSVPEFQRHLINACPYVPPECYADPTSVPLRLRIKDYDPAFFGEVKILFLAACSGSSFVLGSNTVWDGTFPYRQDQVGALNYNTPCQWYPTNVTSATTPLMYNNDDPTAGRGWLLNENTTFTYVQLSNGVAWQVRIGFNGSSPTGTLAYNKAFGDQPTGIYTYSAADTSASLKDDVLCYVPTPATLELESY